MPPPPPPPGGERTAWRASSGNFSGSDKMSVLVHRYLSEFSITGKKSKLDVRANRRRGLDGRAKVRLRDLLGLRSTSVQCCSTQSRVERYKSSMLDVDTKLLNEDSSGLNNKLNCSKKVKENNGDTYC